MKISVITPTYNSISTLKDCIESVLNQTYADVEYIVVDGASTDGTPHLIRSYESAFGGRMKWVSEKDAGLYDAMNKGIGMASGDVVGVLNSDDFFTTPFVLAQVAKTFATQDIDAVYGDIHFVEPDNLKKCVRYYSSVFFYPALFRFGLQPAHPTFYCKREWFERLGGYRLDLKIAADFELLTRFLWKNRLETEYLKLDFVTMRLGGISTQSLRNRHVLNLEDVKACHLNGLRTHYLLVCCKYFIKAFEHYTSWRHIFEGGVKRKALPNSPLIEAVAAVVHSGRSASLIIRGNSMIPFLMDGRDEVILSSFEPEALKPGAVVLVRSPRGGFLLHRIIRRNGNRLTLQGDGILHSTEQVLVDNVIAMLTGIVRRGKKYDCNGTVWRWYSAVWTHARPVRNFLLRAYIYSSRI